MRSPTSTSFSGVQSPSHAASSCGAEGVLVSFQDSGAGIPANVLPHIFDPFYSTKPDGLGLGLSISQEIVGQYGGKIEVESELSKGALFTVWLPA